VGDIFHSVAGKCGSYSQFCGGTNVGTFSTLCLDECEGHFQLCGGTNVGDIFNSVAGPMWGTFSTLLWDKCG
jgi:hypothetical protein